MIPGFRLRPYSMIPGTTLRPYSNMARAIVHPDRPGPSDHHLAAPPNPASPHRENRHHPRDLSAAHVDDLVIPLLEAVRNALRRLHSSPRTEMSLAAPLVDRGPLGVVSPLDR
jgi:hypothetical protein